jgi:hypothetical protein
MKSEIKRKQRRIALSRQVWLAFAVRVILKK